MHHQRSISAHQKISRLIPVFALATALAACGQTAGLSSGRLAPPEWLHGTWTYLGQDYFEVTSNNVRLVSATENTSTAINFGEMPASVTVTETTKNANRYQFVTSGGGNSATYTFDSVNTVTTDFTQDSGGYELTLQLKKR